MNTNYNSDINMETPITTLFKYDFDPKVNTDKCVEWIREWFDENGNVIVDGKGCNAVIGMSGGKDSTIAAALCVKALGKDRVIGVAMPDKGQGINDADKICEYLGIRYIVANIGPACDGFRNLSIVDSGETKNGMWSNQTEQNIPPRIRMAMLYAIAQTYNGRVVNTCNLSEEYIGYATLFGDNVGSFSPISGMTVTEILKIGDYLGLPYEWVHKVPDDGLPHSTSDEEKIGFSYAELDKYIREKIKPEGYCTNDPSITKDEKIWKMHKNNKFKTEIIHIPHYEPCFMKYIKSDEE